MSEEIDFNKLIVEFVNKNIESFYNTGKDVLKGASDSVHLRLKRSYKDYLACIADRYSKAKSFFIRDEPTYLYNFYVPVTISCGDTKIAPALIRDISKITPFIVIAGSGGSGKSILMRHLLLDTIREKNKVPVFIELRDLNHSEQTLSNLIQDTLHANHFELGNEYIEKAMKEGHFAFLLDGFDEVTDGIRREVSEQIEQLVKHNDKNIFIISSRPDEEFSRWPLFTVFNVDPFTLEQACELVKKLPFIPELKNKFIRDLREGLFERHNSFLSNPLLLSIMLLTHGESADIPRKLSVFYNQAYEALFQRHDALKGAYQRKRLSNLDIQDFSKAFSAFSLQTYDKRIFRMTRMEALEFIEKSKKISNLTFNTNNFLKDAEQSVCLLLEDGLDIAFSHRSFQEYFTARFILHAKTEIQQKLIEKYAGNIKRDDVMLLLFEMNSELLERQLIIPRLEEIEQRVKGDTGNDIDIYLRYFKMLVSGISIPADGRAGYHLIDVGLFHFIAFVLERYKPEIFMTSNDQEAFKAFWVQLAGNTPPRFINPSTLTTRSSIINFLYEQKDGILSIGAVKKLFEIKRELERKHENLDKTLDELMLDDSE